MGLFDNNSHRHHNEICGDNKDLGKMKTSKNKYQVKREKGTR
jgi:hypothetical protein